MSTINNLCLKLNFNVILVISHIYHNFTSIKLQHCTKVLSDYEKGHVGSDQIKRKGCE